MALGQLVEPVRSRRGVVEFEDPVVEVVLKQEGATCFVTALTTGPEERGLKRVISSDHDGASAQQRAAIDPVADLRG